MLQELNHVMDFIEAHLTDELSLTDISDYAGVSDYHFRKIFSYIAGISLSEYIKNRRLSKAASDLLEGEKVTEVAFRYGYESLDGFTRAFKKWSGFLPSEIDEQQHIKSFPKFTFVIKVKGGETMEFRIENKPAFSFAGVKKRVPMQFEGVNPAILELAQSITEEQRNEMHRVQDIEPKEIVDASYDADEKFMKESGDLTHLIGVLTTQSDISKLLDVVPVEAGTWAVFPNEGPFPETMQQTMARTYSEWFPSSDYEVLPAPSFSFTKMSEEKENYAYCEIWIPVKKRADS